MLIMYVVCRQALVLIMYVVYRQALVLIMYIVCRQALVLMMYVVSLINLFVESFSSRNSKPRKYSYRLTQGRLTINNRYTQRQFQLKFSAPQKDDVLKYTENSKK